MGRALVALALAASLPVNAAPRQKVAVLDVRTVQGVAPGTATILTAIIAGDVSRGGFDVLSQSDIAALIGFEKQKRMLGCGDDSSCLAEIGGALGAEFVLFTQVGQIGSRFHLSLQLLDARKAFVVSRVSTFSETTEDALAETAQRAVAEALAAARSRSAPAVARVEPARTTAAAEAPPARASAAREAISSSPLDASPPSASAAPRAAAGPPVARAPRATRGLYVEARGGSGWADTTLADVRTRPYHAPTLAARVGWRWTRAWAFEVGGGWEDLAGANRDDVIEISLVRHDVRGEATAVHATAGAVWAPRASRFFSVAADVGVARARFSYDILTAPWAAVPPSFTEDREVRRWMPRAGLEARVDYPMRWLTVGLRVGLEVMRNGSSAAVPADTMYGFPGKTWLEAGWMLSIPATLAVRYEF